MDPRQRRVVAPWLTRELLQLRRLLLVCVVLDAIVLLQVLSFALVPARSTDLALALFDWTGGELDAPSLRGFAALSLAWSGLLFSWALGAWANPRRHLHTLVWYGRAHFGAALAGAAFVLSGHGDDVSVWAVVLQGATVSTLVWVRQKAALQPFWRERDAEIRRWNGWTFDRLAGAPPALFDAVLKRGLGPLPSDLVGLEYRVLRLHPLLALARRQRAILGFFEGPADVGVEAYRLATSQGSIASSWGAPLAAAAEDRSGWSLLHPAPGSHALVIDGPRSRRNLPQDPGARLVLDVVMANSGDPSLLAGRLRVRIGSRLVPLGRVVLKAWRRHDFTAVSEP